MGDPTILGSEDPQESEDAVQLQESVNAEPHLFTVMLGGDEWGEDCEFHESLFDRNTLESLSAVEFTTADRDDLTRFQLTFHFRHNPVISNQTLTAIFSRQSNEAIPSDQHIDSKIGRFWGRQVVRRLSRSRSSDTASGGMNATFFNIFHQFDDTEDFEFWDRRYEYGCKLAMRLGKIHRGGVCEEYRYADDMWTLWSHYIWLSKTPRECYEAWTLENGWRPVGFVPDDDSSEEDRSCECMEEEESR